MRLLVTSRDSSKLPDAEAVCLQACKRPFGTLITGKQSDLSLRCSSCGVLHGHGVSQLIAGLGEQPEQRVLPRTPTQMCTLMHASVVWQTLKVQLAALCKLQTLRSHKR